MNLMSGSHCHDKTWGKNESWLPKINLFILITNLMISLSKKYSQSWVTDPNFYLPIWIPVLFTYLHLKETLGSIFLQYSLERDMPDERQASPFADEIQHWVCWMYWGQRNGEADLKRRRETAGEKEAEWKIYVNRFLVDLTRLWGDIFNRSWILSL